MKTVILLVVFALTSFHGVGQKQLKTKVKEVFEIYSRNAQPKLEDFATNLVNPKTRDTKDGKNLINANLLFYKTRFEMIEALTLENIVDKVNRDPNLIDKKLTSKIQEVIKDHLQEKFPGLTYEFYEKSDSDVSLLK